MREAFAGIGSIKVALFSGQRVGVVVEPAGVRANVVDRVDLAHAPVLPTAEIATARAVAQGAVLGVELLTGTGPHRIYLKRASGRRVSLRSQPVRDELERFAVERRRHCAGAERRTAVAFLDEIVVAVPMQVHVLLLARTLQ